MECPTVRQALHRRIDGELPPEQVAAVDAHLANCPDCREVSEQLQTLIGQMKRLDRFAPLAETTGSGDGRTAGGARRWWPVAAGAGIAAAIAAAVLLERPAPPTHVAVSTAPAADKPEPDAGQALALARNVSLHGTNTDRYIAVSLPTRDERVHLVWLYPRIGAREAKHPRTRSEFRAPTTTHEGNSISPNAKGEER